jgi:hypothetical protein
MRTDRDPVLRIGKVLANGATIDAACCSPECGILWVEQQNRGRLRLA